MQDLFVELLQIALGNRDSLSKVPTTEEWISLFEESARQSVVAICLNGVNRISKNDLRVMANMPLDLKFKWIGLTEQIRRKNIFIDKQTAVVWRRLKDDGLDAAILKGQGIATLYGSLSAYRQSGDIDIWVKGGYKKVRDYVLSTYPTDDVAYHRFHYDFFKDTEVELHHRPTLMRNLLDDRKLAMWYDSFGVDSFIYLENKDFAVPSVKFNSVFILTHIYRHFLFEGIGLRQVMDYYFVLKSGDCRMRSEIVKTLKDLRLTKFAEAMMWILHVVLGLEEKCLICRMDEKEGRFVLREILQTGNFGYSDTRYKYRYAFKLRRQMAHGAHLLFHYPSEVIWTPIWLLYHKVWKWKKKREIHRLTKKMSICK